MTKVLIPNGTSPTNLGDQAILTGFLNVIRENISDAQIVLQTYDPQLHAKNDFAVIRRSLPDWTAFASRNFFVRVWRLLQLIVLLCSRGKMSFMLSKELQIIAKDFYEADLILFTGGGYLRSRKGITQSLNVLLQLTMFYWANIVAQEKKRIVGPISFGPFGYRWLERITAKVLANCSHVLLREEISFERMSGYDVKNIGMASDHALLLTPPVQSKLPSTPTIGFTIREWGTHEEFERFKKEFSRGVAQLTTHERATLIPVIQVDAEAYGEGDTAVVNEMVQLIAREGVNAGPVQKVTSVDDAMHLYGGMHLMISMRMHANILAAVSGTPFLGIAYEHKTTGIAKLLGLGDCVREMKFVDADWVFEKGLEMLQQRELLRSRIIDQLKIFRKQDVILWQKLLTNYENN
jgi:colanic acid/amylovoran biosynthesis protein